MSEEEEKEVKREEKQVEARAEKTVYADRLSEYEELLKEYEETLNKLFGTKIRWSKLSLKELEQLSEALTKKEFLDKICKKYKVMSEVETIIDRIIPEDEQGIGIKLLKRGLKIIRRVIEEGAK